MSERPIWATWGKYRGQPIWYLDALMLLSREQLDEVEFELADGTTVRAFREYDPPFGRDESGILSF